MHPDGDRVIFYKVKGGKDDKHLLTTNELDGEEIKQILRGCKRRFSKKETWKPSNNNDLSPIYFLKQVQEQNAVLKWLKENSA